MILKGLIIMVAYLLGSIPSGYLIVKFLEGKDVRREGSGNIGATNVFRTSNKIAGVITLISDAGKGYLAVLLAKLVISDPTRTWVAAAAVAAIVGHIFPVFLKFKGGKGVATAFGAYLAISPLAIVSTTLLFVIIAGLTKYVSLGSIVATMAFPVWAYLYWERKSVVISGAVGAALIIAKHYSNIRRLFRGEENKFVPSEKAS